MKIKDYKCKCGSDDFFFVEKENNMGIYCSYCGKWRKWANKDERNLSMNQEQKTGRWIFDKGLKLYLCSECGMKSLTYDDVYIYGMDLPNYCEDCGSKMEVQDAKI